MNRTLALCAIVLFCSVELRAQEFAREVSQFVGDNARPFLQPVVDAFKANAHAGLYTNVAPPEGLHIGVSLVAMAVAVPDDQKSFTPKPFSKVVEFTYNGVRFLGDLEINPSSFPTAAGLSKRATFSGRLKRIRPKGSPYVPGLYDFVQQDATVSVGGYRDISTVLFAAPQVSVGSVFGTELLLRYLPKITVPDVGTVGAFGIGAKHNVGRYFALPVDVFAQVMYQSFSFEASDEGFKLESDYSAVAVQLFVSRTIQAGPVGFLPYAATGLETGPLDVSYDFADPYIGKQKLTFDNGTQARLLVGLGLKVSKFVLNVDYNLALLNGFSVGAGVAF